KLTSTTLNGNCITAGESDTYHMPRCSTTATTSRLGQVSEQRIFLHETQFYDTGWPISVLRNDDFCNPRLVIRVIVFRPVYKPHLVGVLLEAATVPEIRKHWPMVSASFSGPT